MVFSVAKLTQGRIGIKKIAREIDVIEGDSVLLVKDKLKNYGEVLILKKITNDKIEKILMEN